MVLPVYFLILFPLLFAAELTWVEYLRLFLITVGWWYCYRFCDTFDKSMGSFVRFRPVLVALALMFVVTQFDPSMNKNDGTAFHSMFFLSIVFILSVVAFIGVLRSGDSAWYKLSFLDAIVVVTLFIVLCFLVVSFLLFGSDFDWGTSLRLMTFAMLWFWSNRWLPTDELAGKRLFVGISIVFGLVCLVGLARISMTFYYYQQGESAQKSGDLHTAIEHFDRVVTTGRKLQLGGLTDAATFEKAEVFYRLGDMEKAAKTLSLTDKFVLSIPADTWEGAAGGMLYTNINCWKDLTLYEGRIRIKIFARGDVALDVWPRMRVKLGDQILGEVNVDSPEVQPYIFEVEVGRARKRLDIAFLNDYFAPPENRNLWIEHAEVHFVDIAWK